MKLESSNKINPNFSMSSLTDIIFLLLIFFMLTSTFVTPNGLNLLLPSSNSQTMVQGKVSVSITQNLEYYVGQEKVNFADLRATLAAAVAASEDPKNTTVVLNAEKTVPIDEVVQVMNIANEMNVRMLLATSPKE
ncbi:MAG: biopolymer transporter ExbD [Chitinophagales bacterium]